MTIYTGSSTFNAVKYTQKNDIDGIRNLLYFNKIFNTNTIAVEAVKSNNLYILKWMLALGITNIEFLMKLSYTPEIYAILAYYS